MKRAIFKSALLVVTTVSLLSFDLPKDWFKAGDKPGSYDMGIEKGAGLDGKNAATIKSVDKKINGFGTLMQECEPGHFLGKRVKMSAYVKSENVKDSVGLWFRVDQANSKQPLSFDNMQNRSIKGTTDWAKYEIILDVPVNASMLAYGALISGTGQIWFNNITFEVVDNTVKTTGYINSEQSKIQIEPMNLNFEK